MGSSPETQYLETVAMMHSRTVAAVIFRRFSNPYQGIREYE